MKVEDLEFWLPLLDLPPDGRCNIRTQCIPAAATGTTPPPPSSPHPPPPGNPSQQQRPSRFCSKDFQQSNSWKNEKP
jgi:hypothetical protein